MVRFVVDSRRCPGMVVIVMAGYILTNLSTSTRTFGNNRTHRKPGAMEGSQICCEGERLAFLID
jgi:hypothetical protein